MVSTNRKKPESRTYKRICRFECDLSLVLLRKISNPFQANVPLLYPLKTSENQKCIAYFYLFHLFLGTPLGDCFCIFKKIMKKVKDIHNARCLYSFMGTSCKINVTMLFNPYAIFLDCDITYFFNKYKIRYHLIVLHHSHK